LPRAALAAVLVAVGVAFAVVLRGVGGGGQAEADVDVSSAPAAPRVVGPERLARLRWDEVQDVLAGDVSDVRILIEAARGDLPPAARYLGGLLQLAGGDPEAALEAIAAIRPEVIPPPFLYAPYRLHGELRPETPNPYLPALRAAVETGTVGPLLRARVQSLDGDAVAAIADYLRTDPSEWTQRDVLCIAVIFRHEGLARDARALIAAALRSGRVADRLRGPLSFLAIRRERDDALVARELRLRDGLREDGPAARVAAESARLILEMRRRYLARDYRGVLDIYPATAPTSLSTETVLLAYLSSVALGDREAGEPWALELRRRHPEPEVLDWLARMEGSPT
jgi:hypothetical protein